MITAPSKTKILIVDDDAVEALGMCEMLSLVGLEVVGVATRVKDALCLAEDTRPDVAILDIRLAGQRDGIEGALILRRTVGLPVIIVTGQSDAATIARAAEAQPVALLAKPVRAGQLVAAVETAISAQ